LAGAQSKQTSEAAGWKTVADIPDFPFTTFAELQNAIKERTFSLGVDTLSAARWSDEHNTGARRLLTAALSLLLVLAGAASVIAALWVGNYWLLAAMPIQLAVFYVSHPASPIRKWVTVAGAASVFLFVEFLFNRMPTAATLVAYAGLTFASVRAAGFMSNAAFRRALASNETMFLEAYAARACTVRENKTERVYGL
jgi:hypothetical protein